MRRLVDHQACAGVLHLQGALRSGQTGVEGDEHGAEARQGVQELAEGVLRRKRGGHEIAFLHAQRREPPGGPGRRAVELRVRDHAALGDDCGPVAVRAGAEGEPVVQRALS